MQILIDVPPILHDVYLFIKSVGIQMGDSWHALSNQTHVASQHFHEVVANNRNVLVPITVLLLLFWPILLSLIMAFTTAWAWIFWLFTSMILGIIQLGYAIYQFSMIACDIAGLSGLKTYSVCRRQIIFILELLPKPAEMTSSSTTNANSSSSSSKKQRKRQRRLWRQKMVEAGNYENFLKIRVESKDETEVMAAIATKTRRQGSGSFDHALPPQSSSTSTMSRTRSFGNVSDVVTAMSGSGSPPSSSPSSSPKMTRNRSFSGIGEMASAGKSNSLMMGSNHSSERLTPPSSSSTSLMISSIDPIVAEELGERTADLLVTTTQRLREARMSAIHAHQEEEQMNDSPTNKNNGTNSTADATAASSSSASKATSSMNTLIYLLSGVIKRNHLKLDDIVVDSARVIEWSGQYGLTQASRQVIRAYFDEVERGLDLVSESEIIIPTTSTTSAGDSSTGDTPPASHSAQTPAAAPDILTLPSPVSLPTPPTIEIRNTSQQQQNQLLDRITLVRKMKQNMGRTALMLSGGGAQSMYHMGVVRALIESKLYQDIHVVSGTSGGSITAAMLAIKTPEELYNEVCVPWVSTDYGLNGEMKKHNIRWFPPLTEMAKYWMETKLMVDSADFRKTCEFYYSDITFEEAFEKTGKHACITVSASRTGGGGDTAQRLLLNHISTPHVTLASAVAASCALPGVMKPAKLMSKNSGTGELEPFEVDGVEWIDGSVQADLPFQRISTLFAVSSFIVSQTNFHVVPFLNKAHHPHSKSLYWRLFQTLEWDIRSRALKLSRLGLFPRFFGQDMSKVFKQRYHGNLTIVPRFTTMQTFGLKALSNPTVKDMEDYLKYGQIATWPYLNAIRDMIRLEKALDDCLQRLEDRLRSVAPDFHTDWSNIHDDIDSIASSSAAAAFAGTTSSASNINYNCSAGGGSNRAVRIASGSGGGSGRPPARTNSEMDRLRKHTNNLEQENICLRRQLEQMKMQHGGQQQTPMVSYSTSNSSNSQRRSPWLSLHKSNNGSSNDKNNKEEQEPSVAVGAEGGVWRLVRQSSKES